MLGGETVMMNRPPAIRELRRAWSAALEVHVNAPDSIANLQLGSRDNSEFARDAYKKSAERACACSYYPG